MGYCRNCGKEVGPQAIVCVACGVPPLVGDKHCQNCGAEVEPRAEVCVRCGVRLARAEAVRRGRKSKTASVLLAVFLSCWTWLYTYRRDAWKFWVGQGLSLLNILLVVVTLGLWAFFGWAIGLGVWIWAIVDVAVKKTEWYESY